MQGKAGADMRNLQAIGMRDTPQSISGLGQPAKANVAVARRQVSQIAGRLVSAKAPKFGRTKFQGRLCQDSAPRRVLIAGNGEVASRLVDEFNRHFPHSYSVVGLITNEPASIDDVRKATQSRVSVVGALDDIAELSRLHQVDEVLIADYFAPEFKAMEARILPRVASQQMEQVAEGQPLPTHDEREGNAHSFGYHSVKRALDIVFSLIGLALLLPFLAVLGLINQWTAPGPILFTQERVGLNGRRFQIYKLRTMCVDAEKESGPVLAQHRDTRCTPLGALLRATKIDELPQLYNVLRGEMSLIGPRPERPVFVDIYERHIPRYSERHRVRPGLTGLAQVNGDQLTHVNVKLHYDLMYVEKCSLWLDVLLLARTPLVILKIIMATIAAQGEGLQERFPFSQRLRQTPIATGSSSN